jgi:hypothetical protein
VIDHRAASPQTGIFSADESDSAQTEATQIR